MKFIIAMILLSAISLPVAAQTDEPRPTPPAVTETASPETDIKRWSLEAGVGGLLFFAHGRVAYRLPVLDNKLAIFAEYSPLETEYDLFPGRYHAAMIGARYYADPLGPFNLYLALAAGASFNPTGAAHPQMPTRTTGFLPDFYPYIGLGIDYMFHPNWGLNTQIGALLTLPRAELNLKFVF